MSKKLACSFLHPLASMISVLLLFASWRVCNISACDITAVSVRGRSYYTRGALANQIRFMRHLWLAGTLSDAPCRPHTPERNVTVHYRLNHISCILENVRSRFASDWTEKSHMATTVSSWAI